MIAAFLPKAWKTNPSHACNNSDGVLAGNNGIFILDKRRGGAVGADSGIHDNSGNGDNVLGEAEVVRTCARAKVKRLYKWTCQYCGADFETANLQQRYCKPSHKTRAYELRREQNAGMLIDAEIE